MWSRWVKSHLVTIWLPVFWGWCSLAHLGSRVHSARHGLLLGPCTIMSVVGFCLRFCVSCVCFIYFYLILFIYFFAFEMCIYWLVQYASRLPVFPDTGSRWRTLDVGIRVFSLLGHSPYVKAILVCIFLPTGNHSLRRVAWSCREGIILHRQWLSHSLWGCQQHILGGHCNNTLVLYHRAPPFR